MEISVLFEDAHIIVVEKPPFLVCESTAKKDGPRAARAADRRFFPRVWPCAGN